jgi:catechol-2,3-dioxygenase
MKRLRKGGFEAHLNRARSGDEIERGKAFGRSGEGVRYIHRATRRQFAAEENMFDHIQLKVKDLKASKRFYTAARVRGERQARFICT